jgi:hypothetical protein
MEVGTYLLEVGGTVLTFLMRFKLGLGLSLRFLDWLLQ